MKDLRFFHLNEQRCAKETVLIQEIDVTNFSTIFLNCFPRNYSVNLYFVAYKLNLQKLLKKHKANFGRRGEGGGVRALLCKRYKNTMHSSLKFIFNKNFI